MNARKVVSWMSVGVWIGVLILAGPVGAVWAQGVAELDTAMSMQDNLDKSSPGPSGNVVERSKEKLATAGVTQPAAPKPGPVTAPPPGPVTAPAPGAAAPRNAVSSLAAPLTGGHMITVITGTRVFDPIPPHYYLIDDAVEKQVPESEKSKYYDDGTHGDVTPGDGKYALVDERHDRLDWINQRVKERLVSALNAAEQLTPLEFFGYRVMTTDRTAGTPRNRAWRLVPDPKGGPGEVMVQVPIADPISIPKYGEKQQEQDKKVKNDWALRFLQEFRVDRGNLNSEFYPVHIPLPPMPPTVAPPLASQWTPFSDPNAMNSPVGAGGAAAAMPTRPVQNRPRNPGASSQYMNTK